MRALERGDNGESLDVAKPQLSFYSFGLFRTALTVGPLGLADFYFDVDLIHCFQGVWEKMKAPNSQLLFCSFENCSTFRLL